jgi:colanic acid/amylovoran biosynthesis glycosyltransferase
VAPQLGYVLKRFPRISETFIAAELIELERQGEKPVVFALARPDEPFEHGFIASLRAPVVYLPHRPLRQPRRVAAAVGRALRRNPRGFGRAARYALWPPRLVGFRRLGQAAVLADEMESRGIEHVHAHFATAAARIANLAWRMGAGTYSVTAHAKDIYHREVRPRHLRDKLGPARFVATVSDANRRHLLTLLDGDAHLELVPNSVDLRRLGPPRRGPPTPGKVITVARLVEKKGLLDLIDACAQMRTPGVWLEVVGDGPLRQRLEHEAVFLHAPVVFRGALPQEDVIGLIRGAAVFCLPCVVGADGDRDALPTSVLEAMALGVPVVTTAVGGLPEAVVDGRTGLVVPDHDPPAVADALDRLLGDSELAARLGAGGRLQIERSFSLERSVSRLRGLFAEAA